MTVLLLTSALALGFLHGLGADHLMAIAALSMGTTGEAPALRRARAMGVAVRFAIGHALLLSLGAGALIVLGWSLPIVVERGGEVAGGILLILFGGLGLWSVATDRIYGHVHVHGQEHAHFHLHVGRRERHPLPSAHSHLPTIVGAAFAVSSLRALTMLAPFGHRVEAASVATLLVLISVFAVGILLSMSLFGVAFARLMSTTVVQRLGRAAGALMASASIALGVFWILS
jgi:nickel/cobalt transporter (NicO) family protein